MITVIRVGNEDEGNKKVGEGIVAVVHQDDYTGEGDGWNLLIGHEDLISEIIGRFANRRPLLRQGNQAHIAVLSVLGRWDEIFQALSS